MTHQEMTIDDLGDIATEADLQYFQAACEAYQSRTGCSDIEATDYICGRGDWFRRGYEEIGDFAKYVNEHFDPVTYEYNLEADAIRHKQQLEGQGWDVGAPFYNGKLEETFRFGTWNIILQGYGKEGGKGND
jgi:hypothetical protein